MTPLAAYILEQAQRAHEELLSEQEFLAGLDRRLLDSAELRPPSFAHALTEIRRGGQWPWPEPFARGSGERNDPEQDELVSRRHSAVAAIHELVSSCQDLADLFGRLDRDVSGDLVTHIERGAVASDIVRLLSLPEHRETLMAALLRLEKSRHEFQREMFMLSAADGESPAEIAQAWRVSRQLVSRTIKGKR
jgi:hypothetical protein